MMNNPEGEANARLILNALELLEALEWMLLDCPPSNKPRPLFNNLSAIDNARAVISKVTGE